MEINDAIDILMDLFENQNTKASDIEVEAWYKIKYELLERSDNSDYAVQPTASPKLPSLKEVQKDCDLPSKTFKDLSEVVYNSIKKLGNFA